MEFDSTYRFLEAVRLGQVSRLDRHNYLRKITNNYEEESVNFLLRDLLEFYNLCRKDVGLEQMNYYEESIRIDNKIGFPDLNPKNEPGLARLLDFKLDLEYVGLMNLLDDEDDAQSEAEIIDDCDMELDFNFDELKGPDRLIYLQEIGFIDYLKNLKSPKLSNRKIAALVRPLMGGKITTVQPAVNALINNNPDNNNPYYKSKKSKLKDIRSQLRKLGAIKEEDEENAPLIVKL